MNTDTDLQAALRATFAERAGSVTDGPLWRGPFPADADDHWFAGADIRYDATEMTPSPPRPGLRRWAAPVLAAAAVVAVTSVIVTGGFGGADPAASSAVTPAASNPDVTASADADSASLGSTATVDFAGVITVSHGDPRLAIDIYQDALCPICSEFESRNGRQIAQAVDDGLVAVRYRMVDFLNSASASGTYSTRAYAAMLSVAVHDGGRPGVFARFYAALFDAENQPGETGPSDLSNDDLAALAAGAGASEAAQRDIAGGAQSDRAAVDARDNLASLKAVAATAGRGPGTPTVALDGAPVATNAAGWLENLLSAGGDGSAEARTGSTR